MPSQPPPQSTERVSRHSGTAALPRRGGRGDARPNAGMLLLIALFPALLLLVLPAWVLGGMEWASYDARMRIRNRLMPQPLSPSIIVVGVSQADQDLFGRDLERRVPYQDLLFAAAGGGARVVAFDIFFEDERERDALIADVFGAAPTVLAYKFQTRERRGLDLEGVPAAFASARIALGGDDRAAVERALDDLLSPAVASLSRRVDSETDPQGRPLGAKEVAEAREQLRWAVELRRDLVERLVVLREGRPASEGGQPYEARSMVTLSPPLMRAAGRLGFANIEKGDERIVRRAPLVYRYGDRIFPSLGMQAALSHYGATFADARIEWGRAIEFEPRRNGTGTIRIPIDRRGNYLVNFRGGEEWLRTQPTLGLATHPALADERARAGLAGRWRDAIVLVGEAISGGTATDVEPIPIEPKFPMVGLHANTLDNILKGDFLVPMPGWSGGLASVLVNLVAVVLFRLRPARSAMLWSLLLMAIVAASSVVAFMAANVVAPLVGPVLALLAGSAGMTAYVLGVSERERRLVREVFAKSVSPRIGEEILRNFSDEALWGAQRDITVLFVDIRGYTTLAEHSDAGAVLRLLDRFYATASEEVFRHDGQVNKFLGDAVLALFGALPEEPENHAERALRAAAGIQRAMQAAAADPTFQQFAVRPTTGAGINTGPAVVGIVGGRETRIEYTAIGDSVNVASRLQGLAGEGQIAVGGGTIAALGSRASGLAGELGMVVRPAESLTVKGRRQPVDVYIAELGVAPPTA